MIKRILFGTLAVLTLAVVVTPAEAQHHHRHQVCTNRHHHRVCRWR